MSIDQKISILIIEDNPGDQLLLQENLLSTTLNITGIEIVETLADGIDSVSKNNFSLIFLDLFLPDSSGLSSLTELIKINSRIPVIIYSGLSDTNVALNAITSGAQDFLIKGDYTISLLEKAIRYSIERKHSSDALEASNERYNLVSRATHDMIWDWDLVTDTIYRNSDGWNKIFKTTDKGEGTREDWLARIHPDDRERTETTLKAIMESDTEELVEMEFRIIRDDGTIGFIEDRGFLIRDPKGKVLRVIGASHDITERKNAEQKALLREQRFRSLVQNGSDLIGIIDRDGNYKHAGGSLKRAFGYEMEYLIDTTPSTFIYPEDFWIIKEALANIKKENFIELAPFRFKNAAGQLRWMQTTFTNLVNDPAVASIIVNSRDITEIKLAADEIEKLSMVAKNTLSGVFILDKDRKFQWVNEAFTKITGFTLKEAHGKKPSELLYGKDPDPALFTFIQSQMSQGLSFEAERLNYTKSGKPIWISLQLKSLLDDEGGIKQYFGVQTDITEKKQAEQELKKLSLIAKETTNGVILVDNDQKVLWANDAFTKISGYELSEVIGRSPFEFFHGKESDDKMVPYIKEQIKKQEAFGFEKLNYNKAGEKIYIRVQMQPLFDAAGAVNEFFGLFTDITLEKAMEEKEELEKIIKQKQITEAVFAAQENERSEIGREMHDNVNQLLGATRMYIDMAKRDEKNRETLLTSASEYTLTAIEEIRKLSKTLITPLIKEIGLVESIIDLAEEIMLVHPLRIVCILEQFNEAALSDKFKLNIFRIIQEQINNTLKHARAKIITISIKEDEGNLIVFVSDDGIGFDTTKRKSGVGLTNIKSRSELHNGSVLLTSEEGKGTAMSITFYKICPLTENFQS